MPSGLRIRVHEFQTGKSTKQIPVGQGISQCGVLSPDGVWFVVGKGDKVCIVNMRLGREVFQLWTGGPSTESLAFSRHSSRLAGGLSDTTVLVWEWARGVFNGHWENLGSPKKHLADESASEIKSLPQVRTYLCDALRQESAMEAKVWACLRDFDAATLDERDQASARLEKLGAVAEFALRRVNPEVLSAEARRRYRRALAVFQPPPPKENPRPIVVPKAKPDPSADEQKLQRVQRGFELLAELKGDAVAAFYAELARGPEHGWFTQQGRNALKRK